MQQQKLKMNIITSKEFTQIVKGIHNKSGSRKFCFIIGAGASISSGIPTGADLAHRWYDELKEMMSESDFNSWKIKMGIKEDDFGSYYGVIYNQRFKNDHESGYEDLNRAMEHARPSFGYSVLAKILSSTEHNIVITTNFDSLVEASLYYYTGKHPLVCSHESLSGFAKPDKNRPLVAKIHRDLLLSPMSKPEDIEKLDGGWKKSLDNILTTHIPIVIGYGGNDGSLMGYLDEMQHKPSNLFWCIRDEKGVNKRVKATVEKLGGRFVNTDGFDHLMFDLMFAMEGINLLGEEIEEEARRRADKYKEMVKQIQADKAKSSSQDDKKNARELSKKAPKETAYSYLLKAYGETDIHKRGQIFEEGITKFRQDPVLLGQYAVFLTDKKNEHNKADRYFQAAIEIDPTNTENNSNYAYFLYAAKKQYDQAEQYYLKALDLDSNNLLTNFSYANFLEMIRKKYDQAELHYLKCLAIEPKHVNVNTAYANFLYKKKKEYNKAEEYYLKALESNPNDAITNGNYATFLFDVKKDHGKSELYFLKSIAAEPGNPNSIGSYANFLNTSKKDKQKAEEFYLKALAIQPNHVNNICNYANFLSEVVEDYNKAESYYLKAIKLEPENVNCLVNYAAFLNKSRNDKKKAKEYYSNAIKVEPNHAIANGNYAQLLLQDGLKDEAESFMSKAFEFCEQDDLLIELWFYRYAHYKDYLDVAVQRLNYLIDKGNHSHGWDFSRNIKRAIQDGHPNPEKLKEYARKISVG